MDFVHRLASNQPQGQRMPAAPETHSLPKNSGGSDGWSRRGDLLGVGSLIGTNIMLFVVALLIATVAWFIYSTKPASQAKLVDNSHLQAVFLNTGQVYFGNISTLNKDYVVLSNVYYLQSDSTSAASKTSNQNLSLIKLGCELHRPYDRMVVNASEVTFWENLQADGQVAKAVAQFKQQNPNGQKCSDAPAPASSSSNLQSQGTGSKNQ